MSPVPVVAVDRRVPSWRNNHVHNGAKVRSLCFCQEETDKDRGHDAEEIMLPERQHLCDRVSDRSERRKLTRGTGDSSALPDMSAVCFDLKSNQSAKRVRELRLWSTHYGRQSKAFSLKPSAGMIDVRQRPAPRLNRRKPRERRHAQKILRDVLRTRSVPPLYAVRDTPRWRCERERGRTRSLLPTLERRHHATRDPSCAS